MSNVDTTTSHGHDNAHAQFDTRPIWRTFWILLGITMVELLLATIHLKTGFPPKYVLNGVYLILTCAKAFYIIAEFMHLRHEIKNMIMTIAVPALLFVWFVIAFVTDGNSYRELRNRYDKYQLEQNDKKVAPEGGEHETPAVKPGSPE
ncbi:MAG TPA: cytochrome C oxidase subunit IV family protein [Puia sp.]|uniref:cytochrome C oxidase subunit IV family protein n=1 Tax=Puia sp. TaxID=2045100 RepID=UPI002BC72AE9|nr:cytochrome C oxidase subunit IV family protein [Puia sp.]HVU97139.1 cytochrome C oxidase subunit IV family protein [Puia sp.]